MPDWSQSFWYALAAVVVLLLPGLVFLAWHSGRAPGSFRRRDLLACLADAVALSIALSVLLGFGLHLAGVRLSPSALIFLYGACLAALGVVAALGRFRLPAYNRLPGLVAWAFASALLIVTLAAWRLYQARGLALPPWVDPVHHTLMVRIILEYGGIPADFLPYIPSPFYYHFGFHLVAALFARVTQLPAHDAVLWFGQVLNALVALSVYRTAYTFSLQWPGQASEQTGAAQPRAAVVAVTATLLVVFAFQMPAYYLTWGRYTLLTALILLGPTLAAAWEAWHEPGRVDAWLRLALLLAGMALTHYYMVVFTGLFIIPLFLWTAWQSLRDPARRPVLLRLALWCALGLLLVLPWLWRVAAANTQSLGVRVVTPLEQDQAAWNSTIEYLKYVIYLVGPRRSHILLGLAGVGLLVAWLRPQMRLFAVWALVLALFSLPWGIRFSQIRPDYFAIILFFPAAVLLANLLVSGAEALGSLAQPGSVRRAWLTAFVLSGVVVLLLAWGIRETSNIINPVTVLASPADRAALDWVNQNTPPEARFFINTTGWMQGLDRGVDGGFWLLPYTGRASLLPPVIYVWGEKDYVQQVRDYSNRARQIQGCGPEFWDLVRDASLSHIYLREGAGSLQPAMLQDCPRIALRYQQDGIYIYEINRP